MYEYLPLSKEKYLYKAHHLSGEQFEKIYNSRINDVSSLKTNLYPLLTNENDAQSNQYPIFVRYTVKMIHRMHFLRRKSNQIKQLTSDLPGVAKDQFLSSLLLSEISDSNTIEGVRTNAHEISTIIAQEVQSQNSSDKKEPKRLRSTVKLYYQTERKQFIHLNKLEDFRRIYDSLLAGEIPAAKKPNGKLFRDTLPGNETLRIGSDSETVHVPPKSEKEIDKALTDLIDFMNNQTIPALIRGLITHFFFENTHPFIDGNGRMGRYLLSTYLARKYDIFTGLSVSTAIHKWQPMYYRMFKDANKLENRAEMTFFVEDFLRILLEQQDEVITGLNEDKQKLDQILVQIKQILPTLKDDRQIDNKAALEILFYLAQSKLFARNKQLRIKDKQIIELNSKHKISFAKTKMTIKRLKEIGLIKKISSRPKQHILMIDK